MFFKVTNSWWRHQMATFSALLALCAGNSPVTGEFPSQRPVKRSFDGFLDLRLNKRLSKQSWACWFEKQSRSLWRHRNVQGNWCRPVAINSPRPRQHGRHSIYDFFNCIFLNETFWIGKRNFTRVIIPWSNWQYVSVDSGDDFALTWW